MDGEWGPIGAGEPGPLPSRMRESARPRTDPVLPHEHALPPPFAPVPSLPPVSVRNLALLNVFSIYVPQRAPAPPWPRPGPHSPPLRAEALPRLLPHGRRALPGSDGCGGSGGEGGRPRGRRAPRKPPEGPVDEGASRRIAHPPCVFLRTPSFSCYSVRAFFQ